MTVAPHLLGIRISNFRSIVAPLEVPLKSKMTFLVGQNNSGKTGVLRFLGLIFNNGAIVAEDGSAFTTRSSQVQFSISIDAICEFSQRFEAMPHALIKNGPSSFQIARMLDSTNITKLSEEIFNAINVEYFDNPRNFGRDFSQSSTREENIAVFLSRLLPQLNFPKTVYVPSQRMILTTGVAAIPQFGQVDFPGTKINLNTIVQELASLDRPDGTPSQRQEAQKKLAKICEFIAFCLEVETVVMKVPDGKRTIYVTIDGIEQPISNLGSGIEQLIVIGMGSFMFPNQLVLIDEPEIHFHPRTQKRMMKYLYDNADAKFVIATHSAAILDSVEADIVQVWQENHQCLGRTVQNSSDHYEAIRNLGHSPSELVLTNFVIWVEGPSDRIYINHWIQKLDPSLIEGTDYAVIFYGGSVLARHGFEDIGGDEDLVKALSISRNFAVYMDSDKEIESHKLKSRVERVAKEVEVNHGLGWISEGREIENYLPEAVLSQMKGFKLNPFWKFGKVVSGDFDKVKFAEKACKFWNDEWPHDLRARCEELVARIQAAR